MDDGGACRTDEEKADMQSISKEERRGCGDGWKVRGEGEVGNKDEHLDTWVGGSVI